MKKRVLLCYLSTLFFAGQAPAAEGNGELARLLARGEYSRARAEAQDLTEEEPKNSQAWTILGLAEYALGDLGQACEDLESALTLKSQNKEALRTLALARHQRGDWEKAQQAYESWAKLSPAEAEPLIGLGVVLSARKKDEEAAQAFRKAVKAEPKNFRARIYAEISGVGSSSPGARAKEALREARKDSRDQGRKDYSRGLQLREVGDLAGAVRAWEEALARNPDDKDTRKAYEKLMKALKAKADAYCLAGQKMEEGEAFEDAREAYRKALLNDPDHAEAARHLLDLESSRRRSSDKHAGKAQSLAQKGRLQEAASEYQMALAFEENPSSRSALRTALRDIKTENTRLLYLAGQALEKDQGGEAHKLMDEALALEPCLRPMDTAVGGSDNKEEAPVRGSRQRHQEMYLEGLSSYVSGDLEKAIEIWSRILRENPKHHAARDGVEKARAELETLKRKGTGRPKS